MTDEKTPAEGAPRRSMEQTFTLLEERVDGLSSRVKELAGENARLKAALIETAAERDRLKKELEDSRETSARQAEIAALVSRFESEREEVRSRIERLVKSLEETESVPSE